MYNSIATSQMQGHTLNFFPFCSGQESFGIFVGNSGTPVWCTRGKLKAQGLGAVWGKEMTSLFLCWHLLGPALDIYWGRISTPKPELGGFNQRKMKWRGFLKGKLLEVVVGILEV